MQDDGKKTEHSRQELLDVKKSIVKKLSSDLCKIIKCLGLETVKSTRRGERPGKSRTERLREKMKKNKQNFSKATTLTLKLSVC